MSMCEWRTRSSSRSYLNKFLMNRSVRSPDTLKHQSLYGESQSDGAPWKCRIFQMLFFLLFRYCIILHIVISNSTVYVNAGRLFVREYVEGTDFSMAICSIPTNRIIWHIVNSRSVATIDGKHKIKPYSRVRINWYLISLKRSPLKIVLHINIFASWGRTQRQHS